MAGKNESKNGFFADAGERLEEAKGKPGRICQGKKGLTTDFWKLGSVTELIAAHGEQ